MNDEVAVAPKYAGPYAEKREVEALANCWRPVQLLAEARLSESEVLPPSDTAPPPERPEPLETVIDELASWLLPMVVVETNDVPLYERRVPVVYVVALVPPLRIPSVPVKRLVPMDVVATIDPFALVERS